MDQLILNGTIIEDSRCFESGKIFLKTPYNQHYVDDSIPFITPQQLIGELHLPTKFIGITGTNGKTTTAFAISYLLHHLGYNVGTQGTLGFYFNLEPMEPSSLTTPTLLTTLKRALKFLPDFFVMEVSSHAIAQGRVEGIPWVMKVFTSFSQDHLDYHHTLEEYKRVKESFFQDETPKVIRQTPNFHFNPTNAIVVDEKKVKGLKEMKMIGDFNRYNLMLAVEAVHYLTGLDKKTLLEIIAQFPGVEGRTEVVQKEPPIIIDFAHTPDGIEKVLQTLPNRRKIVVIGAGGNRDRTKRLLMGKAVDRYADFIILTNDNPRCENPSQILTDLSRGIEKTPYIVIPDRKKAIEYGISLLGKGDALYILGKGAERYIELCGEKIPFQDRQVVEEILKKSSHFQTREESKGGSDSPKGE
jgi:UDP-N-acetylmuramoyl-L-alanyl-D-glutamate--2,6-diaminopimelate ligase